MPPWRPITRWCAPLRYPTELSATGEPQTTPRWVVATGTTLVSTTMRVPTDLTQGTYQVSVVANGIASDPVNIVFFLEPCRALQNRIDVLETLIQNDLDLLM